MLKTIPVACLILLLSACSGSRYYFNKRIHHPEQEKETVQTIQEEKTEFVYPQEQEKVQAYSSPEPVPDNNGHTTYVKEEIKTGDLPVVSSSDPQPVLSEEKSKSTNVHPVPVKKTLYAAPAADVSGWGIFFIIIGAIFLLTVLISLALGYTIGQALLYGLIAVFIIIVLLLYLAAGGDFSNDNDDNGDDNNDD